MRKSGKVALGLILVALGVLFLGHSLNWWYFGYIRGWWTLVLIIPAVISIVNEGFRIWNSILGLFGVALLLRANGLLRFNIWYVAVAAVLIIAGVSIIRGGISASRPASGNGNRNTDVPPAGGGEAPPPHKGNWQSREQSSEDYTEISALFNTVRLSVNSQNYQGGRVSSVFGGVDLDLRGIALQRDAILSVEAVFGSVNLVLPPDLNVLVSGTPFLGSISQVNRPPASSVYTLRINCSAAFGGIEIL